MLPYNALIALELATRRADEARREAEAWRLTHARHPALAGRRPRRASVARALVARPVRAFSNVAHGLSDAACRAATRIEGRAA